MSKSGRKTPLMIERKPTEKHGKFITVGQSLTMYSQLFSHTGERSVVTIATIGIRLLPQEKETLTAIAQRTDTTISQIMRKLIREYITSYGEKAIAEEKEN